MNLVTKEEFSMFQTAGIPILKVDSNITDSDFHKESLSLAVLSPYVFKIV